MPASVNSSTRIGWGITRSVLYGMDTGVRGQIVDTDVNTGEEIIIDYSKPVHIRHAKVGSTDSHLENISTGEPLTNGSGVTTPKSFRDDGNTYMLRFPRKFLPEAYRYGKVGFSSTELINVQGRYGRYFHSTDVKNNLVAWNEYPYVPWDARIKKYSWQEYIFDDDGNPVIETDEESENYGNQKIEDRTGSLVPGQVDLDRIVGGVKIGGVDVEGVMPDTEEEGKVLVNDRFYTKNQEAMWVAGRKRNHLGGDFNPLRNEITAANINELRLAVEFLELHWHSLSAQYEDVTGIFIEQSQRSDSCSKTGFLGIGGYSKSSSAYSSSFNTAGEITRFIEPEASYLAFPLYDRSLGLPSGTWTGRSWVKYPDGRVAARVMGRAVGDPIEVKGDRISAGHINQLRRAVEWLEIHQHHGTIVYRDNYDSVPKGRALIVDADYEQIIKKAPSTGHARMLESFPAYGLGGYSPLHYAGYPSEAVDDPDLIVANETELTNLQNAFGTDDSTNAGKILYRIDSDGYYRWQSVRNFTHGGVTGSLIQYTVVVGETSGATGVVLDSPTVPAGTMKLTRISGSFENGEKVKDVDNDGNYVTISNEGAVSYEFVQRVTVDDVNVIWFEPRTVGGQNVGGLLTHDYEDNYYKWEVWECIGDIEKDKDGNLSNVSGKEEEINEGKAPPWVTSVGSSADHKENLASGDYISGMYPLLPGPEASGDIDDPVPDPVADDGTHNTGNTLAYWDQGVGRGEVGPGSLFFPMVAHPEQATDAGDKLKVKGKYYVVRVVLDDQTDILDENTFTNDPEAIERATDLRITGILMFFTKSSAEFKREWKLGFGKEFIPPEICKSNHGYNLTKSGVKEEIEALGGDEGKALGKRLKVMQKALKTAQKGGGLFIDTKTDEDGNILANQIHGIKFQNKAKWVEDRWMPHYAQIDTVKGKAAKDPIKIEKGGVLYLGFYVAPQKTVKSSYLTANDFPQVLPFDRESLSGAGYWRYPSYRTFGDVEDGVPDPAQDSYWGSQFVFTETATRQDIDSNPVVTNTKPALKVPIAVANEFQIDDIVKIQSGSTYEYPRVVGIHVIADDAANKFIEFDNLTRNYAGGTLSRYRLKNYHWNKTGTITPVADPRWPAAYRMPDENWSEMREAGTTSPRGVNLWIDDVQMTTDPAWRVNQSDVDTFGQRADPSYGGTSVPDHDNPLDEAPVKDNRTDGTLRVVTCTSDPPLYVHTFGIPSAQWDGGPQSRLTGKPSTTKASLVKAVHVNEIAAAIMWLTNHNHVIRFNYEDYAMVFEIYGKQPGTKG